jgi:hypothetical protein
MEIGRRSKTDAEFAAIAEDAEKRRSRFFGQKPPSE